MRQRRSLSICAALLILGSVMSEPALAQPPPPLEYCVELYRLWTRYESHFTLHSAQKARAEMALECECSHGRYVIGVDELKKLLRRGLVPIPAPEN